MAELNSIMFSSWFELLWNEEKKERVIFFFATKYKRLFRHASFYWEKLESNFVCVWTIERNTKESCFFYKNFLKSKLVYFQVFPFSLLCSFFWLLWCLCNLRTKNGHYFTFGIFMFIQKKIMWKSFLLSGGQAHNQLFKTFFFS